MSLEGKRILITGVMTRESLAYAIAERAQLAGAEVVLTSFGRARRLTERAARRLPDPPDVLELDVTKPDDFERLTRELRYRWESIDAALHAIAFAPEDALGGNFLDTPSRSAAAAFEVSAYSLQALTRALLPLLTPAERGGASIVGLDFDASVAWPAYDWMGVVKAALEAVSRYLARDLGPRGVRVNLVAAGPLRTVAARAIPGFAELAESFTAGAPLGWDTSDASAVADVACFLMSDAARLITGEIVHADGGFHAVAQATAGAGAARAEARVPANVGPGRNGDA